MTADAVTVPNIAHDQASALASAAALLDAAKQDRADLTALVAALDHNMQLWVAINTLASKAEYDLPSEAKTNLAILGRYVRDVTFSRGAQITDEMIDTLSGINLRIADGLLVGIDSLPKV